MTYQKKQEVRGVVHEYWIERAARRKAARQQEKLLFEGRWFRSHPPGRVGPQAHKDCQEKKRK